MSKKIISSIVVMLLVLGFAGQASAQSIATGLTGSAGASVGTSGVNTGADVTTHHRGFGASSTAAISTSDMASAITKSDTAINDRITALNTLNTKVQAMVKVSASEKASLSANIQTDLGTLTNLKAKIDADTDGATLRTDITSITQGNRIYALVIPQGTILAASDKAETTDESFVTLGTKLQTRIAAAQSAGKDVSTLQSEDVDFNSKVSDANTQAQSSVSVTASLTPDEGNATVAASNKQALETGRTDLKASVSDLKTAYSDAKEIVSTLESMNVGASVSASTTATVVQ
jgi:hypothetical protein